jgi:hypothetical protein
MNNKQSVLILHQLINLDRSVQLQPEEMKQLYKKIYGRESPSSSFEYLRRKIAWGVQAAREGGFPESARQHALAISNQTSIRIHVRRSRTPSTLPHATVMSIVSDHDSRLPMPGSIIFKQYQGRTIVVRVLDAGFEYDRQRFASLSAIAKEITGTKWNGFVFFGLEREGRGR